MPIQMPRFQGDYPDRHIDCQQALEEIFMHVLMTAERCGWSRPEAAAAIEEIAANHLVMGKADCEIDALIASVCKTKH